MDPGFIRAKSVFAVVVGLIVFGGIIIVNSGLRDAYGILRMLCGVAMVGEGMILAKSYIRRI
jgi:hypothetical protein